LGKQRDLALLHGGNSLLWGAEMRSPPGGPGVWWL
jgi:hypothetical protein